ncbi:MAG: DUF2357 domain-containing protein [Solirubrobacteraceae bacterium]|nr:DUF2357 domain-containing protein [Solirubrobacteraceae bacterium]
MTNAHVLATWDAEGRRGPVLRVWPRAGASIAEEQGLLTVVEGATYGFSLDAETGVRWEPAGHVEALDETGRSGFIRTREAVGRLELVARATDDDRTWRAELEVRPRKLASDEYEALWREISEFAAEATVQGFAPSFAELATAEASASLRYARVAQIAAVMASPLVVAGLEQIVRRPHREWRPRPVEWSPGQQMPLGRGVRRSLLRPGPRVRTPVGWLPRRLEREVPEVDLDTSPNRFARWVIDRWLADVDALTLVRGGDARVGRTTLGALRDRLAHVLAQPPFRDARRSPAPPLLTHPVIQRRVGYRDLLAAFMRVELAPALDPQLPDAPVLASQRNVATLYELWCCLTVIAVIDEVLGAPRSSAIFVPSEDETALTLRAGARPAASWTTERWVRPLSIALYYNRTFSPGSDPATWDTSWSAAMRPDISVRVAPYRQPDGVWLHFDAKYRLAEAIQGAVDDALEDVEADDAAPQSGRAVTRADLLKMHAYRDAVRQSAGAYVLFPGDGDAFTRRPFAEVLPGIGAFALRPGETAGRIALREHLSRFFEHVADPLTADEQIRRFTREVHVSQVAVPPISILCVPEGEIDDDEWRAEARDRRTPEGWLSCRLLAERAPDGTVRSVWRIRGWEIRRRHRGLAISAHLDRVDPREAELAARLLAGEPVADEPRVVTTVAAGRSGSAGSAPE